MASLSAAPPLSCLSPFLTSFFFRFLHIHRLHTQYKQQPTIRITPAPININAHIGTENNTMSMRITYCHKGNLKLTKKLSETVNLIAH